MRKKNKTKYTVNIGNAHTRPDYLETLRRVAEGNYCPFCEDHFLKNHKQPILKKGKYWIATLSNWPYKGSRHHFLLIVRKHIERVEKLSGPQWAELHAIFNYLNRTYNLKGATFFTRSGDTNYTGATVNHLHAHIVTGGKRKKNSSEIMTPVGFHK